MKTLFALVIVLGSVTAAAAQDLPLGKWELVGFRFGQKADIPIGDREITLNINKNGHLGGNSGCNVYGGSYDTAKGRLKISNIISTMMACGEPTMAFEHDFHAVLDGASTFTMVDGKLTIIDSKSSNYLQFREATEPNKCPPMGVKPF